MSKSPLQLYQDLVAAVRRNASGTEIKVLLDQKADVNMLDQKKSQMPAPPLLVVSAKTPGQDPAIFQQLIEAKADVNRHGIFQTLIHMSSYSAQSPVWVALLLRAKADTNLAYGELTPFYTLTLRERTGLSNRATPLLVRQLLNAKADIETRTEVDGTTLRSAIYYHQYILILTLLAARADITAAVGRQPPDLKSLRFELQEGMPAVASERAKVRWQRLAAASALVIAVKRREIPLAFLMGMQPRAGRLSVLAQLAQGRSAGIFDRQILRLPLIVAMGRKKKSIVSSPPAPAPGAGQG